jgi:hypothetical protein
MTAEFRSSEHSQPYEISPIEFDLESLTAPNDDSKFPNYSIDGVTVMNKVMHFVEGQLLEGDHPVPEVEEVIKEYLASKQAEQYRVVSTIDDMPDVNHKYAEILDTANELSSSKSTDPIKIVDSESFQRLTEIDNSYIEGLEGFNKLGRIVLKENPESIERYGDNFLLHKIIHETHHSSKAPSYNLIHTRTIENPETGLLETVITPKFNECADFTSVKITEENITPQGQLFEETYAELNTLIDMKELKEIEGCHHAIGIKDERVVIIDQRNNDDGWSYVVPMRFAMAHNHHREDLASQFTDYNWASYSLYQLDSQSPGIIDDLTLARDDPDRFQEMIRKINDVRPGLYGELNNLSLNEFKYAIKLTDPRRLRA